MKDLALHSINFTKDVSSTALNSKITVDGKRVDLLEAFVVCIGSVKKCCQSGKKVIFVGNGGSSAIANHQATDYWKNGGVRAISFSESSMLTCLSNDYGYEHVFSKSIEGFADKGDVVIAISSSGKSQNILNAVKSAKDKECKVITFSGFSSRNPLRSMGDVNFYVPSSSYGVVEVAHHLLIHSILEARLKGEGKI